MAHILSDVNKLKTIRFMGHKLLKKCNICNIETAKLNNRKTKNDRAFMA
jgi:hypothetical protein